MRFATYVRSVHANTPLGPGHIPCIRPSHASESRSSSAQDTAGTDQHPWPGTRLPPRTECSTLCDAPPRGGGITLSKALATLQRVVQHQVALGTRQTLPGSNTKAKLDGPPLNISDKEPEAFLSLCNCSAYLVPKTILTPATSIRPVVATGASARPRGKTLLELALAADLQHCLRQSDIRRRHKLTLLLLLGLLVAPLHVGLVASCFVTCATKSPAPRRIGMAPLQAPLPTPMSVRHAHSSSSEWLMARFLALNSGPFRKVALRIAQHLP